MSSRHSILAVCLTLALSASVASPPAFARARIGRDGAQLRHALEKLLVVGRVLYIAAHPDDENTALLTYLAGERKLDAAYLSVTRGDGGQNMLGTEIRSLLGVIRTYELLEARKRDGAWQFFTSAKDFGYSKSPDESLRIWGKEAVLRDMVWVIRRFRPDVVVTRFPEQGKSHGHHIASARLAHEAFLAAGDPKRFPEQLAHVRPWRPKRLVHNVSQWMLRRRGLLRNKDVLARFLRLDVGAYNPLLGLSYGEIAARSRSMHKSQGFGVIAQLGPIIEYFQPIAGPKPTRDILDGVNLSWSRFRGGEKVTKLLRVALERYRAQDPAASIPALLAALRAMRALPADPRVTDKIADVTDLIIACAGLVLDLRADAPSVAPGTSLALRVTALNRSGAAVRLLAVELPSSPRISVDAKLARHLVWSRRVTVQLPADAPVSAPSWLRSPSGLGRYRIPDPRRVEQPVDPAPIRARFQLRIAGEALVVVRGARFVWRDRVRGEQSRRVEVMPPVTVTPVGDVLMLPNGRSRALVIELRSAVTTSGTLALRLPAGWRSVPERHDVRFVKAGELRRYRFTITPPSGATGSALVVPFYRSAGRDYAWREHTLRYSHIPTVTVLEPARVKLVPLQLAPFVGRVGYVAGSGDLVAPSLRQVGVDVRPISDELLANGDLSGFRTIVVGVRAFNVNRALRRYRQRLFDWVARGGTLVVQYNTSSHWGPLKIAIGPYPISLGQGRVTDENAPIRKLLPTHPALRQPNLIGPADFSDWVQERGLYFATRWDAHYQPLFRIADPGEKPLDGSLLVAAHGKGIYVYTGLAFFRQLPAGVRGAYRLFLNILSLRGGRQKQATK